jgi:hypothetical protein
MIRYGGLSDYSAQRLVFSLQGLLRTVTAKTSLERNSRQTAVHLRVHGEKASAYYRDDDSEGGFYPAVIVGVSFCVLSGRVLHVSVVFCGYEHLGEHRIVDMRHVIPRWTALIACCRLVAIARTNPNGNQKHRL